MASSAVPWAIVVPVKRLAVAKSRLDVVPAVRADLALAMTLDTVAAALACDLVGLVIAVSDDPRASPLLSRLGAAVVPDEPDAGLNPALAHGARTAATALPGAAVAALSADLPALRPHELLDVLMAARRHATAMVADEAGVGTTMLTALLPVDFRAAFGAASRAEHLALGAADLSGIAGASVRRDVDTLADLRAAEALGCGPATLDVLARHPELMVGTHGAGSS
jgi:2-phospho-L-lactate guanylyltransferase